MCIDKNTYGFIFGRKMNKNGTDMGNAMRYVVNGDRTGDVDASGVIDEENDDIAGTHSDIRDND